VSLGNVFTSISRELIFVTGTLPGHGLFFTRMQNDLDPSAPTIRIRTLVDLLTSIEMISESKFPS
jgi:hypothetical protein